MDLFDNGDLKGILYAVILQDLVRNFGDIPRIKGYNWDTMGTIIMRIAIQSTM